jgi:hypothetical protein
MRSGGGHACRYAWVAEAGAGKCVGAGGGVGCAGDPGAGAYYTLLVYYS